MNKIILHIFIGTLLGGSAVGIISHYKKDTNKRTSPMESYRKAQLTRDSLIRQNQLFIDSCVTARKEMLFELDGLRVEVSDHLDLLDSLSVITITNETYNEAREWAKQRNDSL
tara:strand:+ start:440 stop:778 length:339 start_codon:yes stop_codon:yes gene_type:complete